jgi:hypothetical protein
MAAPQNTKGTVILDSLSKIRAFSNGERVFEQFSGESVYVGDTERTLYPDIISSIENPDGSVDIPIKNLYNYYINNKLVLGDLGPFDSGKTVIGTTDVIIQDLGVQNLGRYARPCEKALIQQWGKQKYTEYVTLVIDVTLQSGVIIDTTRVALVSTFIDSIEYDGQEERIDENTAQPDEEHPLCVASKKAIFFANDQFFGNIPLNESVTKEVILENKGDVEVFINNYAVETSNSRNFKILQNINNVKINPNSTFSFKVEYTPLNDSKTPHKFIIKYDIIKKFGGTSRVLEGKFTSELTGNGVGNPIDDIIDQIETAIFVDDNGTYTYKTLSQVVDISTPVERWKTEGLWKCEGEKLSTFFTGSNGLVPDAHYLSIYNKQYGTTDSYNQFDISFGHKDGLGSKFIIDGKDIKPSKTMYKKYLLQCYDKDSTTTNTRPSKFKFKNDKNGDYVYFIQLNGNQFKDMLDPGNFELSICPLSSSLNQLVNTGSNVKVNQNDPTIFTLIDESLDGKQVKTDRRDILDSYYIVSGSRVDGIYGEPEDDAWGVVFPRLGLIVLDGAVLDQSCSFNTVTASLDGQNSQKLFLSISGSSSTTLARNYSGSFFARSAERNVFQTYFCRANQGEFNYSNNPTYTTGTKNRVVYEYFVKSPKSYITSIGLYNDSQQLVAIGKLKRPILKDTHKSYVFQVRVRLV